MFSSYLAGGEFWVLPDDFIVQMPENKEYVISDFDVRPFLSPFIPHSHIILTM